MSEERVMEGYKQTEVGVIPEDWNFDTLGSLDPYVTSGSRGWAQYYSKFGDAFIRITNLDRASIDIDLSDLKHVLIPDGDSEGQRTELRNGDILISITADIGIIGYVDDSVPKPAYINQHVSLVRFEPDETDSRFVAYFLASEHVQSLFVGATDQGAKAGINLETVRQIRVALPPLDEQKAIASTLSDIDNLLASLDRLIAKKRDLKQATMQQLLTGKKRLPGFGEGKGYKTTEHGTIPEDWSLIEVGKVCGFIVPGRNKPSHFDGSIPWITTPDLTDGGVVSSSKLELHISPEEAKSVGSKIVPENSVLMSCVGDLGIVALTQREIVVNQQLHAFIPPKDISPVFLMSALQFRKTYIYSVATITAVPYLNKDNCNSIPIAFPDYSEQIAIAQVLTDMDTELTTLQTRRAKTQALKQAMMQELLTGKTRLLPPTANA